MKMVVLSASLILLSFLGTASSDPKPVVNNSAPSIDFDALASGTLYTPQSSTSRAVGEVTRTQLVGYCSRTCENCSNIGDLCSGRAGKCELVPLCFEAGKVSSRPL
jgi:hypothetical protein